MTIIKITGYDLLYNCSEVSKTQFFILNVYSATTDQGFRQN